MVLNTYKNLGRNKFGRIRLGIMQSIFDNENLEI